MKVKTLVEMVFSGTDERIPAGVARGLPIMPGVILDVPDESAERMISAGEAKALTSIGTPPAARPVQPVSEEVSSPETTSDGADDPVATLLAGSVKRS